MHARAAQSGVLGHPWYYPDASRDVGCGLFILVSAPGQGGCSGRQAFPLIPQLTPSCLALPCPTPTAGNQGSAGLVQSRHLCRQAQIRRQGLCALPQNTVRRAHIPDRRACQRPLGPLQGTSEDQDGGSATGGNLIHLPSPSPCSSALPPRPPRSSAAAR